MGSHSSRRQGPAVTLCAFDLIERLEGGMPEYCFYRVDRRSHRLGSPEVADCANDDEAVAHAKRILTGYVLEVCQADRMVKHVEPEI